MRRPKEIGQAAKITLAQREALMLGARVSIAGVVLDIKPRESTCILFAIFTVNSDNYFPARGGANNTKPLDGPIRKVIGRGPSRRVGPAYGGVGHIGPPVLQHIVMVEAGVFGNRAEATVVYIWIGAFRGGVFREWDAIHTRVLGHVRGGRWRRRSWRGNR